MPINWQDPETKDRILASIIASFDNQINCKEVARIFGGEATYNAIENFLRKPKKLANQLKAEAAGKEGPVPSPARPRTSTTPKSSPLKGGVKSGRVTKKKMKTESPIKKETFEEDSTINSSGDHDGNLDDSDFA
ncbi:hypothetical protein CC78DRAFT_603129 [Lojkania enalia]|uniref:Uncharacterized protein n=1 Tax=Lojkania enalia TaxID=147567 RepID=A0A9P4N3S3_9PLEO|nr:hypothetical protein CC78DRAFT_603129 [Didymosphaeria enalia]